MYNLTFDSKVKKLNYRKKKVFAEQNMSLVVNFKDKKGEFKKIIDCVVDKSGQLRVINPEGEASDSNSQKLISFQQYCFHKR